MGSLCFLAKFCRAAVVNDGVKKKPLIQNTEGAPSSYLQEQVT
jgi:hypothetical protein